MMAHFTQYTPKIGAFLLWLSSFIAYGQAPFFTSAQAYLAQKRPGEKPQRFAPSALADSGGVVLDRLAFSNDGKEFYYCLAPHWFDTKGVSIKYFRFERHRWRGPFTLNKGLYAPTFSMDGQRLFFQGGKGNVWQSDRLAGGWTTPSLFLHKPYGLYDYMPTLSGTSYVGSNAHVGTINDFSTYDFCTLTVTPVDTVITSLGTPLNTSGFDGDFFVAPDESYMIVSAKETKDYESELHISFRRADKSWTQPQSLGPSINNGLAHRWGQYVSPDGKYLFYTQGTSEKDCHIYWLRFDRFVSRLGKASLSK